ncbi:MAG: Undecaprenyl-diphosphatase BcrC [Verrucomicrobiota bacterium]|jgi:undecaprenyl-diphosphatase
MEQQLLFLLNREWTHPVLDWVLATLSCFAFWVPLLVGGALWLLWKHRLRGAAHVALCVLGVAGNELLVSQPLKTWTNKLRPHQALAQVRRVDLAPATPRLLAIAKPVSVSFSPPPSGRPERGRSFPSAHVMNALTLGLVTALCWRAWAWLLLPLLMAWSRVYTGAHWPSDVSASLLIGSVFTLALLRACNLAWSRWIPRLRPQWFAELPLLTQPLFPKRPSSPPPGTESGRTSNPSQP